MEFFIFEANFGVYMGVPVNLEIMVHIVQQTLNFNSVFKTQTVSPPLTWKSSLLQWSENAVLKSGVPVLTLSIPG